MSLAGPLPAFAPCRLWILLNMVDNFRITAVGMIHSGLHVLINVSNRNQDVIEAVDGGYANPQLSELQKHSDAIDSAVTEVNSLTSLCDVLFASMNCIHINHATQALAAWVKNDRKRWYELRGAAITLRDAIDNELKEHFYYQYPKTRGNKLASWKSDWNSVVRIFPSTEIDIFSATDCYALGHNTAAVFHCMRILEHGLSYLASNLGLTFDIQQWHTMIEQIEAEITKQRKALPRGQEKNDRLQFLSEVAKEFFYFKDGWRNYVSHNRGLYDEHQALSILDHTRVFMSRLAGRFSKGGAE